MGVEHKIINILGNNYDDTILYLVRVLQWLGRKTVICDKTYRNSLAHSVPIIDGFNLHKGVFDYNGVGYTLSLNDTQDYDTVICLYDDSAPECSGVTIIITDESKSVLDNLLLKKWNEYDGAGKGACLLIKEYTGQNRAHFEELERLIPIKTIYQIPPEKSDFKIAILAAYKDKYTFNRLSVRYKEGIAGIVKFIFSELSYKEIDIAIKQAGGGKYKK